MATPALSVLLTTLALAAAGCGGDSDQDEIRQVAEEYSTALADNDEQRACDLQIRSSRTGTGSCVLYSAGQLVPQSPEVTKVETGDDRATVDVTGSNGSVVLKLVKEGDDWRIDGYRGAAADLGV